MIRLRTPLISLRRPSRLAPAVFLLAAALLAPHLSAQTKWSAVGPDGGDARSFAAVPGQPSHLYLGITHGWIYESFDRGATWHRLALLEPTEDLVVDNILVDAANPERIWASGWKPDRPDDGGLWVSLDGGVQWQAVKALQGQSILSFAQAPSDPRILIAGTFLGVYRSSNAGADWELISPPGSKEIHGVESLAIDPTDPDIVYAGTWHLPWKTDDGGKTWKNIKEGVIDDSDVFSIIIDPSHPRTVFLSACSGIYKSENAGALFHRIEGIPSSARRTRVLMQDPSNHETVYAGTTEGLYKTEDGGRHFNSMTASDVIVNDVFVDPTDPKHVLLATDRGGVLASDDAGVNFAASNTGFSGRKVEALLVDRTNPDLLYAGIVNDKSFGGVFTSANGGASWQQIQSGLEGRDVFALSQTGPAQTAPTRSDPSQTAPSETAPESQSPATPAMDGTLPPGTVIAGTGHGIFALQHATADAPASWQPRNVIANTVTKTSIVTHAGKKIHIEKKVQAPVIQLESRVTALDVSTDVWLASTTYGLLTSRDQGVTWQGGPVMGWGDYLSVTVHGPQMAATRSEGVVLSLDSGLTWKVMSIPTMLTRIHCVLFAPDGTLWLGAREGVYFTHDLGKTWLWIERLPFREADDLAYDSAAGRILASSRSADQIYSIDPKSLTWKFFRTGYNVAHIRIADGRLIAASVFDGILVEPRSSSAHLAAK
jgi:photosystem II stability/assembly factor-like uncharacterized protein